MVASSTGLGLGTTCRSMANNVLFMCVPFAFAITTTAVVCHHTPPLSGATLAFSEPFTEPRSPDSTLLVLPAHRLSEGRLQGQAQVLAHRQSVAVQVSALALALQLGPVLEHTPALAQVLGGRKARSLHCTLQGTLQGMDKQALGLPLQQQHWLPLWLQQRWLPPHSLQHQTLLRPQHCRRRLSVLLEPLQHLQPRASRALVVAQVLLVVMAVMVVKGCSCQASCCPTPFVLCCWPLSAARGLCCWHHLKSRRAPCNSRRDSMLL